MQRISSISKFTDSKEENYIMGEKTFIDISHENFLEIKDTITYLKGICPRKD